MSDCLPHEKPGIWPNVHPLLLFCCMVDRQIKYLGLTYTPLQKPGVESKEIMRIHDGIPSRILAQIQQAWLSAWPTLQRTNVGLTFAINWKSMKTWVESKENKSGIPSLHCRSTILRLTDVGGWNKWITIIRGAWVCCAWPDWHWLQWSLCTFLEEGGLVEKDTSITQ